MKDRGSELRFEPALPGQVIGLEPRPGAVVEPWTVPARSVWRGCRIRYKIDEISWDMVPAPVPASRIAQEVALLANLHPSPRSVRGTLRRLAWACRLSAHPVEGSMHVLVGSEAIEVQAAIAPGAHFGWRGSECIVILRLLDSVRASMPAHEVLDGYLRQNSGMAGAEEA